MMRFRYAPILLFCLCVTTTAHAAGDNAPAWLQQAAAIKLSTYDKEVTAVVLVDDGNITVRDDGRVTKVYNYAVRIIQREGRQHADGSVGYIPDVGKVRDFQAWLIRANGEVRRYGNDDIVDVAGALNDVYNEYRVKRVSAVDEAAAGMVFGYSYTSEDKSIFSQDDWAFQSSIPVLSSRYTLSLPSGWRAESITFNHPKIEPTVNGSTYTWELNNLPPLLDEPLSPSLSNLVARLAVSYYPPAEATARIKTFQSWA
jgi:hypothetical protein